jgi:hypothetical protein
MIIDIGQLEFIHEKLRALCLWLEEETGLNFTDTSIYRIGDPGVHGQLPVRGIDLRCRNNEIGIALESFINKYWTYDPKRPNLKCCLLHGKGANLHLHLQVHTNTERIKIES